MKRVLVSLVLVLGIAMPLTARGAQGKKDDATPTLNPKATAQGPKGSAGKGKADPARLRGMKAALADIEKGGLKLKIIPPPAPPWYDDYVKLVKKECGVDLIYVGTEDQFRAEREGYNALMLLEIEHRYGQGILDRLGKQAMDNYLKAQQGK